MDVTNTLVQQRTIIKSQFEDQNVHTLSRILSTKEGQLETSDVTSVIIDWSDIIDVRSQPTLVNNLRELGYGALLQLEAYLKSHCFSAVTINALSKDNQELLRERFPNLQIVDTSGPLVFCNNKSEFSGYAVAQFIYRSLPRNDELNLIISAKGENAKATELLVRFCKSVSPWLILRGLEALNQMYKPKILNFFERTGDVYTSKKNQRAIIYEKMGLAKNEKDFFGLNFNDPVLNPALQGGLIPIKTENKLLTGAKIELKYLDKNSTPNSETKTEKEKESKKPSIFQKIANRRNKENEMHSLLKKIEMEEGFTFKSEKPVGIGIENFRKYKERLNSQMGGLYEKKKENENAK